MEKTYEVKGMSCVICKNNVQNAIKALDGVDECKVNLLENEVFLVFNENKVNEQMLSKAVKDAGYELVINKRKDIDYSKIKIIISSLLVMIIMALSMGPMFGLNKVTNNQYIQLILCLIVIIINFKYFKSGFKALLRNSPNMDSLICISSSISFIYSLLVINNDKYHLYFETSAMILTIVSIGKYIEGKNKNKATKTIRGLATLIPMQANLLTNDGEIIVPIDQIKKNDVVIVKPGESIPQDGIIILGSTTIDESLITGESLPQTKSLNDEVIGGTINIDGQIQVKVTKNNAQTTLSKIISLTKQATMSKIPIERFADKVAKYFVNTIILLSLVTFIVWIIATKDIEKALNFSLSVLVISCPCALGLATPSAIMVATGLCASNGILIKNPEILEIAHKLKYIVFDKTGTITQNKLSIIDIKSYDDEFINVLSSLEKMSNHPIGKTIIQTYDEGNLNFEHFEQIPSKGLVGTIGSDTYLAGNDSLLSEYISITNNDDIDYAKQNNYSYILVGKNNKLLGIVYIADILKENSYNAIYSIKARNIIPIIATGDNRIAATKIAKQLNISDVQYEITPVDKNNLIIDKKTKGKVGMVGDGINDAIALSNADVSFSLAQATDIANSTSDVILMANELNDIPFLIDVSKKTMRIIKQNLFWALFYNAIFIPLAAGALYVPFGIALNPMIGAATMCVSSIFVLTNALRINNVKKEEIHFMNKTVLIDGMMCNKCVAHTKEALAAIGADAEVSLQEGKAVILNTSLTDEAITKAIEDAGYEVKEIING